MVIMGWMICPKCGAPGLRKTAFDTEAWLPACQCGEWLVDEDAENPRDKLAKSKIRLVQNRKLDKESS